MKVGIVLRRAERDAEWGFVLLCRVKRGWDVGEA